MEALKGETLRERIAKGPMSLTEILDIGIQLTDALDAAHSRGILHRDVKPANIFLGEKNRVKVLDFGLAKLGAAPSTFSTLGDTTSVRNNEIQMTTPGTVVGTVSYMSPEQARGEEVDARTDLFSVGAVLYEMATGVRAFGGTSSAVAFEAILNRTPHPISRVNPMASQLEPIVAKALEKDRGLRYQHASDLHADLKRVRRYLDAASFVNSQPELTAPDVGSGATVTPSDPRMSSPPWYKAGAVVLTLAAIAITVWVVRERRASQDRLLAPPPVADAVISREAQTGGPPAGVDTTPPPEIEPPAAATAKPVGPPRVPAQTGKPSQTVEAPREERRPASTPVGVAPIPQVPPVVNTTTLEAPAVPTAPATESPARANTPPDNGVRPDPTPPPPAAAAAPAPGNPGDATPPTPASAPQKPTATTAPPGEVGQADDEAAIRRVLRSYEQAIETKDVALYRSIRSRLTPAEETLLRNSFRQVDSQEVDIRVESLSIAGRTATARISRQDTLVTRGRRQTQNTTQTLRFEKTSAGWVITD